MPDIDKKEFTKVQARSNARKTVVAFIVIVVVSFICFIPDLKNDLLEWDDAEYVLMNGHIQTLTAETVLWAFTEFHMYTWMPLTQLSLALDYALWGVDPMGYHLTNNIIHSVNAGMFFLLCFALLKRYLAVRIPKNEKHAFLDERSALYSALLAALFFAIHPLRVESVAWIAERKDVLSMFFGIPAVLAYILHTRASVAQMGTPAAKRFFLTSPYYWFSIVLYGLSLLSKPTLVTLPLVLLIIDGFPLKRLEKQNIPEIIYEKALFLLFAVFASVMTMRSQAPVMVSFEDADILPRILNACKSIMAYMGLMIWPVDISPFYLHPMNTAHLDIEYILPIVLIISITVCCALLAKRRPVFLVIWLIYVITLLPVLGIVQVGAQAMAARYTYLPGLPIAILVALCMTAAVVRLSGSPAFLASTIGVALVLVFNCYYTVQHISFWKNDVVLWTRVIDLQPHFSGRAYFQRGGAYRSKGELGKALADTNEAMDIATRKKHKTMQSIYLLRARILKDMGDIDGAIADYGNTIRSAQAAHDPNLSAYYSERGNTYVEIGRTDLGDRDYELAKIGRQEK